MNRGSLDVFFRPASVALIGATEKAGSVGRSIFANLKATSFGGPLFAVNPKYPSVLGLACYPTVLQIPAPVDLAVVVVPSACVVEVVRECATKGVRGIVIISAGFRETGARGIALEQEILEIGQNANIRIIGPNCVGVMNPHAGLNATFAASMARPGHVGLLSQSGAVCTAILDWSQQEKVGFSAFVSTGSMADVEWGDLLDYFGEDPKTRSIIAYMESVPDARRFAMAARRVARKKPIIVLKPGRTEAAARAAASHTGALTGRDDVFEAVFRRCGVLRVDTIAELFNMAEALDKQPTPAGPRLMMVTNAGGAGVLATDALLAAGGELAELAPETARKLDAILPPHWSHQNPVDILGDASHERYARAIEIAAADPSTDGLLVALAPQAMTDPTAVAREMVRYAHIPGKPVLASWMGGVAIAPGEEILNEAGIPTYRYPDSAVRVFQGMWRHSANLRRLEAHIEASPSPDALPVLQYARQRGRSLLTEAESKQLLMDYSIPTVPTKVASTPDEAVRAAAEFRYPVVVKLHSETITHKTDVGGVKLNLPDEAAVRDAFNSIRAAVAAPDFLGVTVQPMVRLEGYELILGASADPQFGPVILFGAGGQLVEVYKDTSVALSPLNAALAQELIDRTKISRALKGVRGRPPVNAGALQEILVRFGQLVVEQPWIKEIDINPLVVSPAQLIALDARVVLYRAEDPARPPPALV